MVNISVDGILYQVDFKHYDEWTSLWMAIHSLKMPLEDDLLTMRRTYIRYARTKGENICRVGKPTRITIQN